MTQSPIPQEFHQKMLEALLAVHHNAQGQVVHRVSLERVTNLLREMGAI